MLAALPTIRRPQLIVYKACAFLALLLPLAGPAHAGGHYEGPDFSGSTLTIDGNPPPFPFGGYGGWIGYNDPGNLSASITATFTWTPDADTPDAQPPDQTIVAETGYAYSGGVFWQPNPPDGGFEADDGFQDGGEPVPTYIEDYGVAYDCTSSGTHYSIQTGPVITLTRSLHASTAGQPNNCGTTLVYGVTASPVTLDLSGGIGPPDAKRYLIGQKCTATLSPGGLTPTTCNWSVDGGDAFNGWSASQASATFSPLALGTGTQVAFFFKKPEGATVFCSAHLAVPNGALPASGLDVSAERQCNVEPPSASFSAYIGDVEFPNPNVTLTGLPDPGSYGTSVGITWPSHVLTPISYFDGYFGGWNYVQLINPDRRRINQGTVQALNLNGISCLDNSWPYDELSYPSSAGNINAFDADGNTQIRADAPSEVVFDDLSYLNAADSFQTWLMYCPPGNDSSYIPIRKIKWFWHASLSQISDVWSMTSSPSDCGWSFDGGLYPDFPEWNERLLNAYLNDPNGYTPPVP